MVRDGVDYALYWLAINRPDVFDEALKFQGAMLAEDQWSMRWVRILRGDTE